MRKIILIMAVFLMVEVSQAYASSCTVPSGIYTGAGAGRVMQRISNGIPYSVYFGDTAGIFAGTYYFNFKGNSSGSFSIGAKIQWDPTDTDEDSLYTGTAVTSTGSEFWGLGTNDTTSHPYAYGTFPAPVTSGTAGTGLFSVFYATASDDDTAYHVFDTATCRGIIYSENFDSTWTYVVVNGGASIIMHYGDVNVAPSNTTEPVVMGAITLDKM